MYSRDGCPYCDKAKDMFGNEISKITLKENEGTPEGVNGVPHFESRASGKSQTGCPSSIDELVNALKGDKNNQQDKLSELDIVMYSRDGCPYCDKAKDMFGNEISKITLKENEGTPEGVDGVPHFESRASGKSQTGCPASIEQLVNALKGDKNNQQDKLSELDIVMYSRDGCPYCDKAKDMFGNEISKITLKENEGTPEGVDGVPHFESRASGKSQTGCPSSIDELVNALKGDVVQENYDGKKIIMYFSDSCGFCGKAKDVLKDVMDKIELRNTKDHPLPNGVNGVPHFEYNGKSHTGCPSNADELFVKLDIVQENYEPTPHNSQYFEYKNYIAPYETSVMDTLSCYSGGCPLKNKSGKVGVPFV